MRSNTPSNSFATNLSSLLLAMIGGLLLVCVGCGSSSEGGVDSGGLDLGGVDVVGGAELSVDAGADLSVDASADLSLDASADLSVDAQQPCCTAAECAAMGMICNSETCLCEAPQAECQADGESCDPGASQPSGFVCVATAADPSAGICRVTCSSASCSSGQFCHADGYCLPSQCTHFYDHDCPSGEQCVPVSADANRCATIGADSEGAPCIEQEECGLGLLCRGECVAPGCAPDSGLASCGPMQRCEQLGTPGALVDLGLCIDTCLPFVDPAQAGCELDEVCWPSATLRGEGECIPTWAGTAQPGDACDGSSEATTCATPDLLCLAQSETSSICVQVCDPLATGSEPGQCPSGQGCGELAADSGATFAYGYCTESCDYNHGSPFAPTVPCTSGGICAPAFFYSASFDVCVASYDEDLSNAPLDAGAACPQGADYAYCRPNGLCLDMGDGLQCMDFCGADIGGGFGSASHPDCSQSGAVCTDSFSSTSIGLCVVP